MLRKWMMVLLVLLLSACSWIPGTNIDTPQPTATLIPGLVPTWTPTPLPPTQIPTQTFSPTETLIPSQTPTVTPEPSKTPAPTAPRYLYGLQKGSPSYLPNYIYPEKGCNWISVAGQVFGKDQSPQSNLLVIVRLTTNGSSTEMIAMTGLTLAYGEGGYEIKLGDHPFPAKAALTAQVYDLKGNVLSKPVSIKLYPDCEKNLILTNFTQIR